MPTTGLAGPFPLHHETIRKVVGEASCGVFVIGSVGRDGKFHIDRVGRSDTDLRQELFDCLGTDSHFKFATFASPVEAFRTECAIFHEFRPPMPIMHPEPPAGQFVRCQHCPALDHVGQNR